MSNKTSAGLRRSALAERIRLREEWSTLKGTSDETGTKQKNVLVKKTQNVIIKNDCPAKYLMRTRDSIPGSQINEILRGTVVLVDVGLETRALALRAALTALGASVMPTWTPLVTHVVWSQGGCTKTRAKARALACRLVSPFWVESCAASARRLPEKMFPAITRPSDLPSPSTLRKMLKKIDQENIPLNLSEDEEERRPRLRISSESHRTSDTSRDTSDDTSHDSHDTSRDGLRKLIEYNVNTATRRALPRSPDTPKKSRRKLFTQKEADIEKNREESDEEKTPPPKAKPKHLTQETKKELARAERIARRLMGTPKTVNKSAAKDNNAPRIVLTGMAKKERHDIFNAIHKLNGKIQKQVDKKTTHVILGSCQETQGKHISNLRNNIKIPGIHAISQDNVIMQGNDKITQGNDLILQDHDIITQGEDVIVQDNGVTQGNEVITQGTDKPRTVNALLGAVRGCRVLYARWVWDSVKSNKWLHHFSYEVPHLLKISQKARIERLALNKMNSEYAYDVFNGMQVKVSEHAEKKDEITQLLRLCGAVTQLSQNGGKVGNDIILQTLKKAQQNRLRLQKKALNGTTTESPEFDVTIGPGIDEISSKWVFDSVAAARMRTTRRYINK